MADKKFECRGCCKYPHGKWSIVLSVFAFLAWLFTIIALTSCRFGYIGSDVDVGFGPLQHEQYDYYDGTECVAYDSDIKDEFDGGIKASKAFGLLGTIFGFFIMIIAFMGGCMSFPPIAFKVIGGVCVVLAVCCLLMLTIFASDSLCSKGYYDGDYYDGCEFGPGAGCAIAGFFLWVISAVFAFLIKGAPDQEPPVVTAIPSDHAQKSDSTPGTVTVTEETLPDGSIKTTKTTINPDGTQTVTESIDAPSVTGGISASAPPIPRREEEPMPPVAAAAPVAASMPATMPAATMPPVATTKDTRPAVATMKDTRPVVNAD